MRCEIERYVVQVLLCHHFECNAALCVQYHLNILLCLEAMNFVNRGIIFCLLVCYCEILHKKILVKGDCVKEELHKKQYYHS